MLPAMVNAPVEVKFRPLTFLPGSIPVTVAGASVTGQNFSDTGAYGISGTVSGLAKAGVTVTLGGASSATTLTDSSGSYSFSGLPNGAYSLTPSRAGGYAAPLRASR